MISNFLLLIDNRISMNYTSKTFNIKQYNNINDSTDNKYRKELIMAKIIISELQDSLNLLKKEKKDLELKLEETLNTLKFIHSNYITLTAKFDSMNQTIMTDGNIIGKNYENKIKELEIKNDELKEEINTKKEINKMQEEALERKISLLEKKLEKTEEELINTRKNYRINNDLEKAKNITDRENMELREENIKLNMKFNEDINKIHKELEDYKNISKKYETDNFLIKKELDEYKNMYEKEQKLNEQQNQFDKYLNNTLEMKSGKYESIMKKYNILLKEKKELEKKYNDLLKNNSINEEYEILKEQNKYILKLLLRITPNRKLIKQIIGLNKEIIQLERKKILMMNNKDKDNKLKNIIIKINEQINKCKNDLIAFEDELINIDFGSSQSNN